jgi:hypothetical protein
MITEDYVSFETAKLLREKGFDWETSASIKVFHGSIYEINREWVAPEENTIIPTLQTAMKWLREVHHINIEIITYWTKDKSMVYGNRIVHNNAVLKEIDAAYNSYEQACESAIKYCLENLI